MCDSDHFSPSPSLSSLECSLGPLTTFQILYPTTLKLLEDMLRFLWPEISANMKTQNQEIYKDLYLVVEFAIYLWLPNILSEN